MYIYYECPECKSEIYKDENEFYICQSCGHKIPKADIKSISFDEIFTKVQPLYKRWISFASVSLMVGLLYVFGVVIYEYVKYGKVSPFESYWVTTFVFILGLIAIGCGIVAFLVGVYLKIRSKKKH